MNLKRVLLERLDVEQLRAACQELGVEADRHSPAAMGQALASSKAAKPERLLGQLSVADLRALLAEHGLPSGGMRDDLVARLLQASGRTVAPTDAPPDMPAQFEPPAGGWPPAAAAAPAARVVRTGREETVQYVHPTKAVQRPDAGVQDQFQDRKPPKTYRYDSSLDPALSWDEQRERDLGEWLLGLVIRSAKEGETIVFTEPQVWAGGSVRITSLADAAQILQQISKPFLNWAGKAERHQITVPTVPLFVHERHSTKAILDGRLRTFMHKEPEPPRRRSRCGRCHRSPCYFLVRPMEHLQMVLPQEPSTLMPSNPVAIQQNHKRTHK